MENSFEKQFYNEKVKTDEWRRQENINPSKKDYKIFYQRTQRRL